MKIAFDASILDNPQPTGVEKSFLSLLGALSKRKTGHQFLIVAQKQISSPSATTGEFTTVAIENPSGNFFWRQFILPKFLRDQRVNLIHSPVSAFPLLATCRKISTIHEIPWMEPGTRGDEGCGMRHRVWAFLAASKADRILCPSKRTASNLAQAFPASEGKVRVLPHGVDPIFQMGPKPTMERPYFLCLGKTRAKKNFDGALRAFRIFLDRTGAPHNLCVAGPKGPSMENALELARSLGIAERVFFPGYLPEKDLPPIYRGAEALIFLSYSEGFGLPPLEAMACGTPVIASDRGAVPEIAGDAAIPVSPDDPQQVAEAMRRLAFDKDFRNQRIAAGKERPPLFRWEQAADRLIEIYSEIERET